VFRILGVEEFRPLGSGFRAWGEGLRDLGILGFRLQDLGARLLGSGFSLKLQAIRFRLWNLG